MTEEGFGLADVVVDFGKSVMGSFPYPSQARQGFHLCSTRTFPTAPEPRQGFPLCSRWRCSGPHNPVRGCTSGTTMFRKPVEHESPPGI